MNTALLISQIIVTIALVFSVIFAALQVRVGRKSMSAQVAVDLFRALRTTEIISTLRAIYRYQPGDICERLIRISNMKHNDTLILEPDLREILPILKNLDDVLDNLELIAALVRQKIIDRSMAVEAYSGSTVLRVWYMLSYYIEYERFWRGTLYGKTLEYFAEVTLDHLRGIANQTGEIDHIYYYHNRERERNRIDLYQYFMKEGASRRPGRYYVPGNRYEILHTLSERKNQ